MNKNIPINCVPDQYCRASVLQNGKIVSVMIPIKV